MLSPLSTEKSPNIVFFVEKVFDVSSSSLFSRNSHVFMKNCCLGTAHYLLGVYSTRDNNFFVKASIRGNIFFSKHMYGTKTFLKETKLFRG